MKLNINLLIVILLAIYSHCEKLVPKNFSSKKFSSQSWDNIIGQEIRCPNEGVIKNFVLRKSNNQYYFDLQCYSSDKVGIDYGEPIGKSDNVAVSKEIYNAFSKTNPSSINSLEIDCTLELGLNGFKIKNDKKLQGVAFCHPTKSSYISKKNIRTNNKRLNAMNLDCFVDILVGRSETENEEVIGYPLRSFQFKVEGTSAIKTCYYIYSYHKLKNMGKLKDQKLKQMEELRNQNTQVD
jgi:hypothetical protein